MIGAQHGAADNPAAQHAEFRPRSALVRRTLALLGMVVFVLFAVLGSWQVKRLFWKLDLIERVEQRVHAPAVAAPGRAQWSQLSPAADEYRHVRVVGSYLFPLTARVQASTELGGGFWLLTPLCTSDGSVVLVNRGFVAGAIGSPVGSPVGSPAGGPAGAVVAASNGAGSAAATAAANGATARAAPACVPGAAGGMVVTGLLRVSEPGGGFLRQNQPYADRWFSRDVAGIAASRGLQQVAPYFIDADAASAGPAADAATAAPVGGLTVISFHNNHLVYAFTWYALALMVASALYWVARQERKLMRRQTSAHLANQ